MHAPATAQLAPVAGEHYAGRASDTGFGGAVGSGGGYSTSVPLDFSLADGSVPMPIGISYGGKRMGAAGLGWDVPSSYVYHDTTAAHRRPESATVGHERWTLVLLGEHIDLVPKNGGAGVAPTIWVPARGNPQLEVRSASGGESMLVYDGEGRTFAFDSRDLTPGTSGQHLANGNLFVLTAITAPGNRKLQINYTYAHPALSGGGTGLAVDPAEVLYDYAGGSCYKHRALLRYNAPSATPLSVVMLGTTALVRSQTLSFIGVNGRRTCTSADERIRTYNLSYRSDVDTGLPQLKSVTMSGQQGTPEATLALPVAAYGYGSIVDPATNQITYQKAQTTSPPFRSASAFLYGLGYSLPVPSTEAHSPNDVLSDLITMQGLVDLNGDGRADFFDETGFYQNTPDASGSAYSDGTHSGTSVDLRGLVHSVVPNGAASHDRATDTTINDTLRMEIDMNGDGRMDVVETVLPDTAHWIIHLNTPDPTDPKKIVWVDVTVPVDRLRAALGTTGLSFGRVPMARNTSVRNIFAHCWFWVAGIANRWQEDGDLGCSDIPANFNLSKTITEFELRDVNGDGYPDFVFNASYVDVTDPMTKPPIPANPVNLQTASTQVSADMIGSHDVKVLINTAGAHLADGVELFDATPITLEHGGTTGCGVARWEPDPSITSANTRVGMVQTCGFQDVNGDGIPDRIVTQGGQTIAALGTGDMNAPYSTAANVVLPGPIGRTESPIFYVAFDGTSAWETPCNRVINTVSYDIQRTRGLRDINGDGIPDYINATRTAAGTVNWTVAMGTGTGFAAPVPVVSDVGLELSLERSFCPILTSSVPLGTASTPTGLYDIDGDGQPEVVTLVPAAGATAAHWDVYQLKRNAVQMNIGAQASIPEAGRLTQIDNGYGVITRISYLSAKTDTAQLHQIPGPEIVVGAVGESGAVMPAPHYYAYGNIGQYFDPSADAFVSTGYLRSVHVRSSVDALPDAAVARITDAYGPQPFIGASDAAFGNDLLIGRTRDVTTLADAHLTHDAWWLLRTDTATDTRRVAGTHHAWATRLLPPAIKPANNAICANADPYAFAALAAATAADDMCVKNGFAFETSTVAWRGTPGSDPQPALNPNVIATDREVKASDVDDSGRIAVVGQYNDLNRGDDDECIQIAYANPPHATDRPRVLNRPATRTVTNCAGTPVTLSKQRWEYDTSGGSKLPAGQVTSGFVTAEVVTRLDEHGAPIPDAGGNADIRRFDAVLDAHGNATQVTVARDDGATRIVASTFDEFGLAPTGYSVTASNANGAALPAQTATLSRDTLTLNVLATTDVNGQQSGATYDGFGRTLTSTVTPTSGPAGVLASLAYQGFAVGESGGRRVVQTVFGDPVAPADVATAPGRVATTFIDSLGRVARMEAALGPDYPGQSVVIGQRSFDLEGRVAFIADPFRSSDAFLGAYGTTYYFNVDGTPACSIRGKGMQPSYIQATDELHDIYPTCRSHGFSNGTEVVSEQGPDALLAGSPQAGVKHVTALGARGLPLMQTTVQTDAGGATTNVLERTQFGYDARGRLTLLRRFQDPNGLGGAVDTTWHYDSLGQETELDEPAPNAPRFRRYDTWGEPILSGWCDPALGTCPTPATAASINRSSIVAYDAYGRVTHREDRSNGVAVPQTLNDYLYDVGVATTTPSITPTNVLGRLAKATSPTSSVAFGYDPYGRINSSVYTDLTSASGNTYVEKHAYRGDGAETALDLLLPDSAGFADERVDYGYDSAGRARSAVYSAGGATQSLFAATGALDIDSLGRITHALYGAGTFRADYDDTGRPVLADIILTSPAAIGSSRQISFAPVDGAPGSLINAFDPLGRERVRREIVDGVVGPTKVSTYDALGRLSTTADFNGGTTTVRRAFTYDALGNLLAETDPSAANVPGAVTLTYRNDDRDRICSIAYGQNTPAATCNVAYDAAGNIVQQLQPRLGARVRQFSYLPSGEVRQIVNATSDLGTDVATFDYDAFGAVQRLVLSSDKSPDTRHDKHFGRFIARRDEGGNSVVTRTIPLPAGAAIKHGTAGAWTFQFSEGRGMRYVMDQTGRFVQTVDYQPFGEVANKTGATPGSVGYVPNQWNDGDLLQAFGLNQVGARIYDSITSRFISRDPVFDAGNRFHPYAFAANDPINMADRSGLSSSCIETIYHRCQTSSEDPKSGPPSGSPPASPSGGGSGISLPASGPDLPPIPEPPSAAEEGPIALAPLPGGGSGLEQAQGRSSGGDHTLFADVRTQTSPSRGGASPLLSSGGSSNADGTYSGSVQGAEKTTRFLQFFASYQYSLGNTKNSLAEGLRQRYGLNVALFGNDGHSLISGGFTASATHDGSKEDHYALIGVGVGPYISIGNSSIAAQYSFGLHSAAYETNYGGDAHGTGYLSSTVSVLVFPTDSPFFIGVQGEANHYGADHYEAPYGAGIIIGGGY